MRLVSGEFGEDASEGEHVKAPQRALLPPDAPPRIRHNNTVDVVQEVVAAILWMRMFLFLGLNPPLHLPATNSLTKMRCCLCS